MRVPSLQYLYLQKPITTIVIIAAIAVLPWLGPDDFHTKGEPREAAVAVSMLQSGNWALPKVYADEVAYKPPMAHWLMAIFSLPEGKVSEWSARLPSAIAYIILAGASLFFFGRRLRMQPAFIAALILITCFEVHRWGLAARVDMLSAMFIVLALFTLYRWEELGEIKGLPVTIPLLLGCATLAKGPVGLVLPILVFGIYLLTLRKYPSLVVIKALAYAGISGAFIPALWYVAAWKQGGSEFISLILAENFGRFLHIENPALSYDLGHRNGIWYHPVMLLAGLLPWSLLCIFALFGKNLRKYARACASSPLSILRNLRRRVMKLDKVRLFSLIALVVIIIFYSIPSSKRSVYILPAYPFAALLLADSFLRISFHRRKVSQVFVAVVGILGAITFGIVAAMLAGFRPADILGDRLGQSSLHDLNLLQQSLAQPAVGTILVLLLGGIAIGTLIYQAVRRNNLKALYASALLTFALNLLIDGVIMRSIRNGNSSRPFAQHIMGAYPLSNQNTFVMNNPRQYRNLYGLNFYMNNIFQNFARSQAAEGYLLIGSRDASVALPQYAASHRFILLETSSRISELGQPINLYKFQKNNQPPPAIQ
ncbi:MAG: glycosyltransferase family 39 protein [Tannerellaceae bacterium]|jgi:4-amino-4-deoxy-L-arabinose transferase-like glycosyltransferase|nr:glycosyltransferase family 39 protein [Tannerellaceae bacterium]